jgi:hypothetical protein
VVAAVPLVAMARAWKALNEFGLGSAGGLTAKTIPEMNMEDEYTLCKRRVIHTFTTVARLFTVDPNGRGDIDVELESGKSTRFRRDRSTTSTIESMKL